MNEFYNCLTKFDKQIEQILVYLNLVESQKVVIAEFDNNKIENSTISKYVEKLAVIQNSSVQYNALIISIYGCFEEFIDNMAETYIKNICLFTNEIKALPNKMTEKYLDRISEYLSNPKRFKRFELTKVKVMENFYNLFNNSGQISFNENICFLISHSGNMTNEKVIEFSKELGLNINSKSFTDKFYFNKYLKEKLQYTDSQIQIFLSKKAGENTIFANLDTLVAERNKVAHGWTNDERFSYAVIRDEIITFLQVYTKTLLEIYIDNFINYLYPDKVEFVKLPRPITVFDNCILCINNENNLFEVGDWIVAIYNNQKIVLRIKTLEINKKRVDKILKTNIDIGIGFEKRFDKKIKDTMEFYFLKLA